MVIEEIFLQEIFIQIFNLEFNQLLNIFNIFSSYKSDVYHSMNINKIVFRYILIDNYTPDSIFRYFWEFDKSNGLLAQGYTNLPNTTDYMTWSDKVLV